MNQTPRYPQPPHMPRGDDRYFVAVQGAADYTEVFATGDGQTRPMRPVDTGLTLHDLLPLYMAGAEATIGYVRVLGVTHSKIRFIGARDNRRIAPRTERYSLRACLHHAPQFDEAAGHWIYPIFGVEMIDKE